MVKSLTRRLSIHTSIHATGPTLISPSLRSQQPARPSSVPLSSGSNALVTNYKPTRLTDKQSDTQVYLTLVALEHASVRLDFGQMASITSKYTDLSVHWNSTVFRSQLTSTPEIGTVLRFLSTVKALYDPSHAHSSIEKHLRKIRHKPGELPRDYLIRFWKKRIQLEDAAIISRTHSEYHIIGPVTEQAKQTMKGMSSEFKSQLKTAMYARQVVRFDSWAKYLEFVTTVQQTVESDDGSSSDGGGKDGITKKKVRSLVTTTGGRKTPKELFPTSSLASSSEWPEERDRCVFDFNKVRCYYGDKCTRSHANTSKSSPSLVATGGSNSPKIRVLDVMMRKLPAQKEQLIAAQEDEGSISSIDSEDMDDPHKAPPLPPTDRARSRGAASVNSPDDLSSLERMLGIN